MQQQKFVYSNNQNQAQDVTILYACAKHYIVSQKTSPTFSTVTWKPIIRFW